MSREGIADVLKIGGAARQPMTHRRIIAGLTIFFNGWHASRREVAWSAVAAEPCINYTKLHLAHE